MLISCLHEKRAVFLLLLLLSFLASCSSNSTKQSSDAVSDLPATASDQTTQHVTGTFSDSLLQKLCKKWYSKKLTLNDLGEEYPANNEELTLFTDLTYTAVDRVEGDSLAGTWRIESEKTIRLTDHSGESHPFHLEALTDEILVTRVLDSEAENISIHYGSMK